MTRTTTATGGALARRGELGAISAGLRVAAVEFTVCSAILLALVALGRLSTVVAADWAAIVLVPLSVTIAFLGLRVRLLSRRARRPGAGGSPTGLPETA